MAKKVLAALTVQELGKLTAPEVSGVGVGVVLADLPSHPPSHLLIDAVSTCGATLLPLDAVLVDLPNHPPVHLPTHPPT